MSSLENSQTKQATNLDLKVLLKKAKEQFESENDFKPFTSEPFKIPDLNEEKPEKLNNPEEQLKLVQEIKEYEEEVKKAKEEIKETKEDPTLEKYDFFRFRLFIFRKKND